MVVSNIFYFHPYLILFGEMIQVDQYFSDGLKPPPRIHSIWFSFCQFFSSCLDEQKYVEVPKVVDSQLVRAEHYPSSLKSHKI